MQQTEHDLSPHAAATLKSALKSLRPHTFPEYAKKRFGKSNDGGYAMLDALDHVSAAYSIGINDDVSWDLAMAEHDIDILQYDHTIDGLPASHPRFRWRKIGLGPTRAAELSIETLPDLIASNGHAGRRDLILKCDIEGMEWAVLSQIPTDVLDQFSQILLETHGWERFANPDEAASFSTAIRNLTENHVLIHVHANNYAPIAVVGGIPIPDVLELSLVRKDMGSQMPSNELFPTALDEPCNPDAADLFIGGFVFE